MSEAALQERKSVTGQRVAMVVVDPVCGINVRGAILNRSLPQPVTMAYEGMHYMFCSDLCRREFEHNPRRYLKAS